MTVSDRLERNKRNVQAFYDFRASVRVKSAPYLPSPGSPGYFYKSNR